MKIYLILDYFFTIKNLRCNNDHLADKMNLPVKKCAWGGVMLIAAAIISRASLLCKQFTIGGRGFLLYNIYTILKTRDADPIF